MSSIEPVSAHLVSSEYAAQVVGPAYDVLTPAERRRISEENPLSFLRVTRSIGDLPAGTDPALARREGAERLAYWIESGVFGPVEAPSLYLYRLETEGHTQSGLVGDLAVSDYEQGLVRRHEHTREEKEAELVTFLTEVGVNSSPVCVTYQPVPAIDAAMARVQDTEPRLDFTTDDGVRHTVWRVDEDTAAELIDIFAGIEALYLTDGHHRAAASARVAAARSTPGRFLVALFPSDQLRILPYNRCVLVRRPDVLEVVGQRFEAAAVPSYEEARPEGRGRFAMYAESGWWSLARRAEITTRVISVAELDVSILHREILGPLLDTDAPDFDDRVLYVPGIGGPEVLEARCRAQGAIGFVLPPTSIEEVMAVSDAGEIMPPKSTWFDPKARSGIFVVFR